MKRIQILCAASDCDEFSRNVQIATRNFRSEYVVETITDMNKILEYGVMYTPALIVNGEVKMVGKIPDPDEILHFIED